MKDQKDWIDNIDDNLIEELIEQKNNLPKVSTHVNSNLIKSLRKEAGEIHKKNKEKKVIEFPRFSMPLRIASFAAMILIVLLTGTFIFINYYNRSNLINVKSVLLSGDVTDESGELKIDKKINQNKIIKTQNNSICRIRIENNSYIQMEENTELSWNYKHSKKDKSININLKSGIILVKVKKLPENTVFQINTENDTITVKGTQFYVDYTPDKGKPLTVAVTEGKVEVNDKINNKKFLLKSNEMIIKNKNEEEIKSSVPNNIQKKLSQLNNLNFEKTKKSYKLYLNIPDKVKFFKIDNIKYPNTKEEINIIIDKKNIDLTLLNENNNILYSKKITLIKRETKIIIKEKQLKKIENENQENNQNNITEDNTNDNENKKWIITKLNKLNLTNENITSFISNNNIFITQTKSSLFCLNKNGKIIWKKTYGKEKNIYFMSPPIIVKNRIYISSINNKMIILNTVNGNEIKIIDTLNNNISFGYQIKKNKKKLYLPFTNGLYSILIDGASYNIKEEIPFSSPTTPLFVKDKIILTSYTNKNISCYDNNNTLKWNQEFENRIFSSPVYINNLIYLIDNKGTLHTLNINGELQTKSEILENGFNSVISLHKNNIYLLSNDGALYSLNTRDNKTVKLFQVDNKPKVNKYLQKSPYIHNDNIFIGTDSGNMIIYDINNSKIAENIKLSDSPIMSTVFKINNTYYTGTENGEIFSLKK